MDAPRSIIGATSSAASILRDCGGTLKIGTRRHRAQRNISAAGKLQAHRAKRNFQRTKGSSGDAPVASFDSLDQGSRRAAASSVSRPETYCCFRPAQAISNWLPAATSPQSAPILRAKAGTCCAIRRMQSCGPRSTAWPDRRLTTPRSGRADARTLERWAPGKHSTLRLVFDRDQGTDFSGDQIAPLITARRLDFPFQLNRSPKQSARHDHVLQE